MSQPQEYDHIIVDIVNYVYHFQVHSNKAWRNAQIALLDALGCAIETISKSSECRKLFGPNVPGTIVPNGFRLPGTSLVLDPAKGAFDLATAIRFLDHNDAIAGADWGHPSDNIGAILAVADYLGQASSRDKIKHTGPPLTMRTLLTAIIKAYEIQGCFLLRNAFNAHGLDHVILVKLASTAVVSWLMGLTEAQAKSAISHVWMDGHPLRVYRSGANTIPRKGWAAGDACMKAVQLALLARSGQPGSPTVLTTERWGFYATMFGNRPFELPLKYGSWVIEHIFFKLMPAEGHGISAIEASLIHGQEIRARGQDPGTCISKVEIRTNAAANLIINKSGPLQNAADRDHCMQYLVALTLLKGSIPSVEDFQDDSPWVQSVELAQLRAKINISADADMTRDYLDLEKRSLPTGVTIHLVDGAVLGEILVEFPLGHASRDETPGLVEEKFRRNLGLMFTPEKISQITEAVDVADTEITSFIGLLVDERAGPQSML